MLGLRPFRFKLMAFVLASFLATAGGVVYVLLIGGATPEVTTPNFTLSLLLMVVLGGAGTRWGAVLGGVLYTFLDNRLPRSAARERVQDLPERAARRRCRSRCSCSARSSSCSSTSCRAASPGSRGAAARRGLARSTRRSRPGRRARRSEARA